MHRWLRARSIVVAVIFGILATTVAPAPPAADAIDPLTAGIAVFRLFQGAIRRAQTYEDIARARDEALAQLAQEREIANYQQRTGVLTGRDSVRERTRILEAEQAVVALSERLKKLTKKQADRFIGSTILNAALLQLSATSGFVKVVRGVDGFLTSAEKGITGMLENVAGAGLDSLAQINAIQEQLHGAAMLLGEIGGPGGRRLAQQLADIERAIASGVSKAEDIRAWVTGELTEALNEVQQLRADVGSAVTDVRAWRPGGLNLDVTKFNDPTTLQMISEVQQLDGSRNAQAIIGGYATRAMERVRLAASGANLNLSVEDLRAIAAMTGRIYLNERLDGRKPAAWEIDLFVWQALNTWLALTGRDPLPSTDFQGRWHSTTACDENEAGYEYRWQVDVSQDVAGVVSGTVTYHACPDGGRAAYSVVGVATTDDAIRLQATRVSARGPLASMSPTHDFIWLTPEGAPSKTYRPSVP